MKRTLAILLSLLMLSAMLVGCAKNVNGDAAESDSGILYGSEPYNGGANETLPPKTDNNDQNGGGTTAPSEEGIYTVKENYLPSSLAQTLATGFEGKNSQFAAINMSNAPYTFTDVYTISDCKLLSVTIPVMNTLNTDSDGNFTFTIYRLGNSLDDIKSSPSKSYAIKINASEYGLAANTEKIYKLIKVDVSEYDIKLKSYQTVAFSSSTDSIIPAYLTKDNSNSNVISNAYKQQFPQATGIMQKVGKGYYTLPDILCFNLEWERSYESKTAYDAHIANERAYEDMISVLKEKYEGKRVSVIGDSISTYQGISNNAANNATTANNAVYYPNNDYNVYDYTYTYWGRLIKDLGMNLCVNNSWSGSRVYGKGDANYKDNMLLRSTELDNDNNTPNDPTDDIAPDVILVYMGINDLQNDSPFGDLYRILEASDGRSDLIKINTWFDEVLARAENAGENIVPGTTYTSFEQAYALSLNAMKEKYPDAEIYCMTLVQTYDTARCSAQQIAEYNRCIMALAGHFGATVIDQYSSNSERTFSTVHAYSAGGDVHCIHPSSYGHEKIERNVIKTMYKKNK